MLELSLGSLAAGASSRGGTADGGDAPAALGVSSISPGTQWSLVQAGRRASRGPAEGQQRARAVACRMSSYQAAGPPGCLGIACALMPPPPSPLHTPPWRRVNAADTLPS